MQRWGFIHVVRWSCLGACENLKKVCHTTRIDQSHHKSGRGRQFSYSACNLKSVLAWQVFSRISWLELVVSRNGVKDAVSRPVCNRAQVEQRTLCDNTWINKFTNWWVTNEGCQCKLHLRSLCCIIVVGGVSLKSRVYWLWVWTIFLKRNKCFCVGCTRDNLRVLYKRSFYSVRLIRLYKGPIFRVQVISSSTREVGERSRDFIDRHRHESWCIDEVSTHSMCNWVGHDSEGIVGKLKSINRVVHENLVSLVQ